MTPDELAALVPRLYHLTMPSAVASIRRLGLLSAAEVTRRWELPPDRCRELLENRRPARIAIDHPKLGRAVLTDNRPLSERALEACLDQGLTPADWLRHLNARCFFWPDAGGVASLLGARANRGVQRVVLVVDTRKLALECYDRVELSPINSGSTIRKPARRGLHTMTPLSATSYREWRRLRREAGLVRGLDRIREVIVRDRVSNIDEMLVDVREVTGGEPFVV